MAYEVTVPRLGWSMEEGTFAGWLKQDGDTVQEGENLFVLESDKSTQEIESFDGGVLRLLPNGPQTGDIVAVGQVIGHLVGDGEEVPTKASSGADTGTASAAPAPEPVAEAAAPVLQDALPATSSETAVPTASSPTNGAGRRRDETPAISPRALRVANELGVDWATISGSGRTGRIVERDVLAAAGAGTSTGSAVTDTPVRASPVARRMAENLGVDLGDLATASPGKRIVKNDVEAAASTSTSDTEVDVVPVSNMRRIIADRMSESLQTAASVTMTTEADATALVELRTRLKSSLGERGKAVPSFNDLFVKLTAIALGDYPLLNARWNDTDIVVSKSVHMGIAVDIDGGLLVPVLKDAEKKSVSWIAREAHELAEKAREGRLSPDDMQGGTFTISNLGAYGVDAFTPIINLPQCAILGIGRIARKPAVHEGQVVPRDLVTLSLSFDHRVVDGGPAARFLNTVREYVQEPDLWLLG